MASFRSFAIAAAVASVLVGDATAQVTLNANKSGSDIVLSWSGGTGPYDVIRSSSPRMSANTAVLASSVGGPSFTNTGAAADTVGLFTYVVSDVSAKPSLNITLPCDTPPGGPLCSQTTTQGSITVSGTTNASTLYVNDVRITPSAGTFTATGTLLNLGQNTITAAAKNGAENWSIDQVLVTRDNGNQAPTISISISDRGDVPIAADGVTIYDPTPAISITYSDTDGAIDPADVKLYINGTDTSFTNTASPATYQVPACPCPPGKEWAAGSNFIYATVQDGNTAPTGYSASASAHVTLGNPVITSFSPAAEGVIGGAITINGAGFDPTPANNAVTFNGVSVAPSGATRTTLSVTVPPGAQTGDVVVTVDNRPSRGKSFRVLLATGWQSVSSVAVNPSVSNHVFFTDKGSNDNLYEILPDGTAVARCALAEATGLPVDSSGNLYFGNATTPGSVGTVRRYAPAGGTCAPYQDTRLIGETTASTVGATLTDVGGSINVYTADEDNDKIKRIDPGLSVTGISSSAVFVNPTGMAANSASNILYFSSTNSIRSIPIPGGGVSSLVRNFVGAPRGLAITDAAAPGGGDKLIIARTSAGTNAVSWYDPASSGNPFWDLATGFPNPPGPQTLAVGSEGSDRFIVVAEATKVYRLPKPFVVLTDDADNALPAKFVIDFGTPTTDCIAGTAITLKVKFSPGVTLIPDTTPSQRVTWTVEDPDDPSPDLGVDPNDGSGPTGNDNVESLGSYAQWEQVATYALTGSATANSVQTDVVGGISKVKFHPSCQPGDNYRFSASVTIPVYGVIQGTSDVLTIWRKLHVERDSMGVALGPFDTANPDPTGISDAVLGDIPDPILDLMAAAFRPAYVEVVLPPDTGEDTPEVRFAYHVPSGGSTAQGDVGRRSMSTEGRWVVYIQGAYEQDIAMDNDPDGEAAVLGVTGDLRNSLTFFETIRDVSALGGWDNQYVLFKNVLHEIGHQFGILTDIGCVMTPGPVLNPVFCSDHLFTIRHAKPPSAP